MVDPVAKASDYLCEYLTPSTYTLVAYAKHFGKVDGNISELLATMRSINSDVGTY
jgi:hypothetical protein